MTRGAPVAPTRPVVEDRLVSRDFGLVMGGSAGGWLAHSMAQWAIAPLLVAEGFDPALGGLGLGVVAVAALGSRMVVGPRIDRHGGRLPAVAGTALVAVAGLAYALAAMVASGSVLALLLVLAGTALQGAGFGAMTTAAFSIVDDVLPATRRGEGVGYFGVSQPIVQGLGAAASFAVVAAAGFAVLFVLIAAIAALTTLLYAAIRPAGRPRAARGPMVRPGSIWVGGAILLPILVCTTMSFVGGGLILAIPLLGFEAGIGNPGIFYLASAVLGVAARLGTGRLSDRLGRAQVAIPGFALVALVIVGLVVAAPLGAVAFVIAGAVHGLATAATLPSVQALVLDRSPADRRGSSSAAMGMAFDVGFGAGSILLGAVAGVRGPSAALLVAAVAPVLSIALLAIDARRAAGTPGATDAPGPSVVAA